MSRSALFAVFCVPAALCVLWTLSAGKDVNWDLLSYHYYGPYAWLGGRLSLDYFAAGAQSYLNPAGYVPFYLMVSAGWHSVVVSALLAAVHGMNIALLYLIAWQLFAHRSPRDRHVLCALTTALGAATAIFWATVGTSFLDPLLAVPMLGGVLLLLRGSALPAGLLFGAAASLKYSNAFFALAALPLAFALPGASGLRARLRGALAYMLGGLAAVALLAGPWLALMWREFGNPVFPLMNAWFKSPHAPHINMFAGRFALEGFWDAALFPLRLIVPDRTLYAEITAPDLRFASLVFVASAVPLLWWRGRRPADGALSGADWRVLGFFAVALLLWLVTSANGRYGILVLLLAGLCLARLVERALPLPAARIALAALIVLQIAACAMVSAPRWYIADRWSARWLPVEPHERARSEPALYLTLETLPMAAVAPFLHRNSSFVNLRGQLSIAPDAPRLEALRAHHARVRALGRSLRLREDGAPSEEIVQAYDFALVRFGYRIDPADCFAIRWRPDDGDLLSRAANWLAGESGSHEPSLSMGICTLVAAERDPRDIQAEKEISALFDRIEKACARLFGGQSALTEPLGKEWMRDYPSMDARLETHRGRVIFDRYLKLRWYDLGPLTAWQQERPAALPAACTGGRER